MAECVEQNWQYVIENWNVIASMITFALGVGGGFVLRVVMTKDSSSVNNKNISAGGDFNGRDRFN